ncbi:MAG: polyprenyl diphosphate synthase [Rickettsiales bacterium]
MTRVIPQLQPEVAALPAHIALIMDGNGRWAHERGVSRVRGHTQGAEALRGLLNACRARPFIRYLTLYAFSTENWQRSPDEVTDLMNLLRHYVKREAVAMHENGVRMRFIGDRESLAADIQRDLNEVEALTAGNEKLTVTMALSYGGRQEIVAATRAIAEKVARGELPPQAIDEKTIAAHLYASDIPEPDLMIRTGGNERLSNFLLWQSAYAELYFTDTLWPDFTPAKLDEAIQSFSQRERRFGRRLNS